MKKVYRIKGGSTTTYYSGCHYHGSNDKDTYLVALTDEEFATYKAKKAKGNGLYWISFHKDSNILRIREERLKPGVIGQHTPDIARFEEYCTPNGITCIDFNGYTLVEANIQEEFIYKQFFTL